MMKKKVGFMVTGAVIAAAYAGLTFLSGFFGLAYGPIQFRVSEVLTVLPVFGAAAIPGLTVGCFIANIASFNPIDMIFGTFATFAAALLTYLLRQVMIKGIPFLSFLAPVVINVVTVGAEIALFWTDGGATVTGFLISALWVALGEAVVCFGLGIPFYIAVNKNKAILERINI